MPKNPSLEYQANVPAFLQRLKAGNAELDGRHNVQIPRARGGMGRNGRLDMKGEEGEDDPVMVDEIGNVISKEEMEAMTKATEEDAANGKTEAVERIEGEGRELEEESKSKPNDTKLSTDHHVISGFGKKRKAVKVIGGEADRAGLNEDDEANEPARPLTESTKELQELVERNKEAAKTQATSVSSSATKKGKRKKVKLSFDEPE